MKKHYKMFKKGKNWCCMAIATLSVAVGTLSISQHNVNADTTGSDTSSISTNVESTQDLSENTVSLTTLAQDQNSQNNTADVPKTTAMQSQNSTNNSQKQESETSNETNIVSKDTTQSQVETFNMNFVAVTPKATETVAQNGWQTEDGNSYYYKDGQKLTGQQNIDGKDYYFNGQGQQQKNYFLNENNRTYYFQADGTRLNDGFYSNWGRTYYFQADGSRLDNNFYTNWGRTYYFGDDGARWDNRFYNNWGRTYYFGDDGARWDNRFYNNWGRTYYFGDDGARWDNRFYNNWGNTYYFTADGSLAQNTNVWAYGSQYHADNAGILSPISIYNNKINSYIMNNRITPANITYQNVIPDVSNHFYTGTSDGKPNMIIVHETANPNDSIQGEINYEREHYNSAFVHAFVDANNIIQISNTDHEAWGAAYPANGRAVQFEQVEVYGAWNFARELVNAAYYTAFNMHKYGLTPSLAQADGSGMLWSHHNVSQYLGGTDHTDPDGYWTRNARNYFGTGYNMNDFLQLVNYEYAKLG
ncbi:N-acetylmuramoyl-L-alanine amidase [Limosilactobacillus balticus]|uniref:N-acetylmuramoyl-L-alanine amidase n=1 Tax=Limosilactobacillus balticus TaxID=2759747 RepID=UPI003994068B